MLSFQQTAKQEFSSKKPEHPMAIIYSEIIWLAAIVTMLTSAALVGLWRRPNPDSFESTKPLMLSPIERELLLQEKTSTFQKTMNAKKAAKKAVRASRRELLRSRRAADTARLDDGTS